jgi:signal transduction histidine kinase
MTLMLEGSHTSSPGERYFGDSRCRSIWQWQLVIAFTVVAMAVCVALLAPARFHDWQFTTGLVLFIALTVITLYLPWHRINRLGVLMIPVLDALVISLLAAGDTRVAAFIWVFPIAWAATYFHTPGLLGMLGLIAAIQLIFLLVLGITPDVAINVVISLITLGFVGVVMVVGAERNRSARRLLSAQASRLSHALGRVQQQKARHQRVLDTLDVGIARVSSSGLVEVSNATFRTQYELDVAAQFHPTRAVEYHERRGTPVPAAQTTIARAARGELFQDEIVWLFGLDGRWRALKTSTKMIDLGRSDDGLLLLAEDVSEIIDPSAGEAALRRSISHELRNPLTALLGHVDLMLERPDLDDSSRRHLDVIEHAGTRMQQLLERSLGTIGEGQDEVSETAEPFDLSEIARASIEGYGPAAEADGVAIEAHLDIELFARADAFRVRQVVDNVIGNAIKYSRRGGRIIVRGSLAAQGEVSLEVSDNGIGIAEADLPHIFDQEFRTEAVRQRGIPGTGLGLSISRSLIIADGGHFEVSSELSHGTQVSIVLPASTAPLADTPTPDATPDRERA